MIIRNSIKSIFRTPVKTALFTLLIAAVTMFLYLGINTFVSGLAMVRDCNENYSTIVMLEYQEDFGITGTEKKAQMAEEVNSIDFEAIAAMDYLLNWQPTVTSVGFIEGFTTGTVSSYSDYCVLLVTGLTPYHYLDQYTGTVVESLYSRRDFRPGYLFFMTNTEEALGYVPDAEETYLLIAKNIARDGAGGGTSQFIMATAFISSEESSYDFQSLSRVKKIDSPEDIHRDENKPYVELAQYLYLRNNALNVYHAAELATVKEFHQNKLLLESGRLFTKEESDNGEKLCVISKTVANKMRINVDDTVNLRFLEGGEDVYTVVGVVAHHEDYHLNIYITSPGNRLQPIGCDNYPGQATIQNGRADDFLKQIEPLLPPRVQTMVYDQGYEKTMESLTIILKATAILTAIALGVAFVVLAFFAYQFANARRETVEIMGCFGTKKRQMRWYLMTGVGLISLVAIGSGVALGMLYAERLITYTYHLIADMQIVDPRFSDHYRGVTMEFTPVAALSYGLALAIAAGILLLSFALCLYYAEKTISGKLITTHAKTQARKEPKKSSVTFRGWLRYALLAIRRSGVRSILIPALSAVTLLFISSLQVTSSSYGSSQDYLYDNTRVRGYFATMSGKPAGNLYITNADVKRFMELEYIADVTYTYTFDYAFVGRTGNNAALNQEVFNYGLGKVIFTNAVEDAPEFADKELQVQFMPGFDMRSFQNRNWEYYQCIVSEDFLRDHKVSLGDSIWVYVQHTTYGVETEYLAEMLIVGSFIQVSGKSNIYSPLPLGALDPKNSLLRALSPANQTPQTGQYVAFANSTSPQVYSDQQFLDLMLDAKHISSIRFSVSNSRRLSQAKDVIEAAGYSGSAVNGNIRNYVVIEDSQFNETLSSLARRGKYLEILYPVLLALVCLLGIITGYLSVHSRREDIALMRGLGVRKVRIFATILGEQILLLLTGLVLALVGWYLYRDASQLMSVQIYGFAISYIVGAAGSAIQQNRKKALAILSEKE